MKLELGPDTLQDYQKSTSREWLETNGLGGYASGTLSGTNTRSYHGLFVAATHPPVGRNVLLSKLEENIFLNGTSHLLSCNQFPGLVFSSPLSALKKFVQDPFPVFHYEIGGIEIKKTICFVHNENVLAITYEVLKGADEFTMELKPFIAYRDFHALAKANSGISHDTVFGEGLLCLKPYKDQTPLYIYAENSSFRYAPEWIYNFEYPAEQSRGLNYREDLFMNGQFVLKLKPGARVSIIISTAAPQEKDAFKMIDAEKKRRDSLSAGLPVHNDFTRTLALAADQFLVKRGDLKTIIAGYHWFSDWGRDTMISLPGICLVTGRYEEAKKILKVFAMSLDKGMIPNRFPDAGETPEYNTVDATLWYFIAIYKYFEYTKDQDFILNEMLPVLEEAIKWHKQGTRYNIHVDPADGLIYSGQHGVQLTWMDAKVGDWVVTPRQGKAVEINALWYNALRIMSEFYGLRKDAAKANELAEEAMNVKNAFLGLFMNTENKSLYDCVDGNDISKKVRPNQLFAISLPFSLVEQQTAASIIKIVEDELLTPYGLRSLSPKDPDYKGHYGGSQLSRDGAYHQGTVWSWLLGPYLSAKIKTEGKEGIQFAKDFFEIFERHFLEAGIGTVSEIFDGDSPYEPNGCIAQAWGVAEVLRVYIEDMYPEKQHRAAVTNFMDKKSSN
jgi:predicted glycogen debranching enzyme